MTALAYRDTHYGGALAYADTIYAPGGATAAPFGVSASALVGTVTATGGAPGAAIALPAGVVAYARVGQAIAHGPASANPIIALNTLIDFAPVALNTLIG